MRRGRPLNSFNQRTETVKCAEGRAYERTELEARRSLCTQAVVGCLYKGRGIPQERRGPSQGTFRRQNQLGLNDETQGGEGGLKDEIK